MTEGNAETNDMALTNPKHVITVVNSTGSTGEAQRYGGRELLISPAPNHVQEQAYDWRWKALTATVVVL